jgi:hypothetical protein
MISRTKGTPMMEAITIMKTAGRLFSKIEFITEVVLTAVALVVVIGNGGGGGGGAALAAAERLEIISCKAIVALVNAVVAFSKGLVAFSNVLVTFSDIAPVAFVVVSVVLVEPLKVAVVVMDSLALGADEEEELASACSEGKL